MEHFIEIEFNLMLYFLLIINTKLTPEIGNPLEFNITFITSKYLTFKTHSTYACLF